GGTWERASIRGRLETPSPSAEEGFRVLRLDEGGEEIEGHVFSSSQLAAHWDELDALVGPEYQRVPVRVTRETGLELEAEAYVLRPRAVLEPPPWAVMLALVFAGEAIFLLPFVLVRIFRPTVLDVLGIDNTQLGTAFSAYGVVALVAYLLGGPLADRYPARKLMVLALLSTAAGGAAFYALPGTTGLTFLYAYFGVTSILPFWSALLRATREWGGSEAQGQAYGLLDGGRGLVSALIATFSVGVFAMMMPDAQQATLEVKQAALRSAILYFAIGTGLAALLVWRFIPERSGQRQAEGQSLDLVMISRVLGKPTLWLQSLIVVCAYVGYKGTDDFSLLAREALGYDDVQAATLGTLSFWVRPVAAVIAGLIADRVGRGSTVLAVSFGFLVVAQLVVAGGTEAAHLVTVLAGLAGTSAFVYALRGVYFAIFDEARVSVTVTGTAVGVVSVLGYTPDIFMGPVMGLILDGHPGAAGHRLLFLMLAAFSALGLVATLAFRFVSSRAA
ncbi:MAG: MFS transporter, partial [Myxococcota bacterium]